jgi:hypothetical protein
MRDPSSIEGRFYLEDRTSNLWHCDFPRKDSHPGGVQTYLPQKLQQLWAIPRKLQTPNLEISNTLNRVILVFKKSMDRKLWTLAKTKLRPRVK